MDRCTRGAPHAWLHADLCTRAHSGANLHSRKDTRVHARMPDAKHACTHPKNHTYIELCAHRKMRGIYVYIEKRKQRKHGNDLHGNDLQAETRMRPGIRCDLKNVFHMQPRMLAVYMRTCTPAFTFFTHRAHAIILPMSNADPSPIKIDTLRKLSARKP